MTTARALRGPFDYRLPEELREDVEVGSMLVVPFGRRQILGVVTGLADHSEVSEEKLLAPLRAMDEGGGRPPPPPRAGGPAVLLDALPRACARAPSRRHPSPQRAQTARGAGAP
jgi:hypothetical protein